MAPDSKASVKCETLCASSLRLSEKIVSVLNTFRLVNDSKPLGHIVHPCYCPESLHAAFPVDCSSPFQTRYCDARKTNCKDQARSQMRKAEIAGGILFGLSCAAEDDGDCREQRAKSRDVDRIWHLEAPTRQRSILSA